MHGEMELAMDDSWAMNLEQPKMAGRHRRTFTYGLSSDSRAKQLYDKLTPRDALAFDLYDTKRILLEDEVYDSYARMRIIMLFFLIHKWFLLYFFLKYKEFMEQSRVRLCGI